MTEAQIPIVPLADAPLSEDILAYLNDIAERTGRYLCFWDARDIRKVDKSFPLHVKARAIAEPNKPFLAIVVDMGEMSRRSYSPRAHDPFIAHEAEHLVLWTEGYRPIQYTGQPESARWAIDATSNWLADPIINDRIYRLGFDISHDRTREIRESTQALHKGIWRKKAPEPSIRFAVSFMLEPHIPEGAAADFRSAVANGLDSPYSKVIFDIVGLIQGAAVSSPKAHDESVRRCFHTLNASLDLGLRKPRFAPKYRTFNEKQRRQWGAREAIKTKSWR